MIKNAFLYIWQLPQNLLGIFLIWIYNNKRIKIKDSSTNQIISKKNLIRKIKYKSKDIYIYEEFPGGISLGKYILVDFYREYWNEYQEWVKMTLSESIHHEHGHCRQSEFLGPLYLPVIGISSGGFNLLDRLAKKWKFKIMNYYDWWPEKWADKLGKVQRKKK